MINSLSPKLLRVIDANINRLKEGIRVVEDIVRYKDNDLDISLRLKELRHKAKITKATELLKYRDSVNDVLRPSIKVELNRVSVEDLLIANFKRAEESSRVLEELFKLYDLEYSENFKYIRYELYTLEKDVFQNTNNG